MVVVVEVGGVAMTIRDYVDDDDDYDEEDEVAEPLAVAIAVSSNSFLGGRHGNSAHATILEDCCVVAGGNYLNVLRASGSPRDLKACARET